MDAGRTTAILPTELAPCSAHTPLDLVPVGESTGCGDQPMKERVLILRPVRRGRLDFRRRGA